MAGGRIANRPPLAMDRAVKGKVMSDIAPLAFFSLPGGLEYLVIGLIALLLFGKRLPDVARSLGQALHEFKSGFSGDAAKDKEKDGKNVAAKQPEPPAETKTDEKSDAT